MSRLGEFFGGAWRPAPLFPYDALKHAPETGNRDPEYVEGESGVLHNIQFQLADGTRVHRSKFRKLTGGE
jgi:hypothetical protein